MSFSPMLLTAASSSSMRSSTSLCLMAANRRRSVPRRAISLARMAGFMSSVMRALSDMRGRFRVSAESIHLGGELLAAQALALALDCGGELALALGGGLLVELAGAQFGQQADFFDLTLETTQGNVKQLKFFDFDVRHVTVASGKREKRE